MITKEIELKGFKFQNEYYVSGHFDFEIEVHYENGTKATISKRYSEIRSLYKELLLRCPGCYIPDIPSKSIWLKINYGNQEQMKDRMEGIKEFLTHISSHKVLRKNKRVISFFSKNSIDNKNTNNNNKDSKDDDSDDNDEFNFDYNYDDNDRKVNLDDNENENDDIEPLEEYVQEINNRNKGIVSKGKKILGNMYSYVKSYAISTNNEDEDDEDNNNKNNEASNVFYKKLSKDDYEYIKKKKSDLGEDYEINEYNEKINRLNEGVKNIIQNFEKLIAVHEKNTHSLETIVNNDDNMQNLIKKYKKKGGDEEADEVEDNSKTINHKDNIKKIQQYCVKQRGLLNKVSKDNLPKIKKHQILLQGLLDIFARKKDHLNFLGKLHSQKEEMEKQSQTNNSDPLIKNKIEDFERKLRHEIKFINKINKDLKYEISNYKKNQEDIYLFINSLFKEKANTTKDCLIELKKEASEEDKAEELNNKSSEDKGKQKCVDDDF